MFEDLNISNAFWTSFRDLDEDKKAAKQLVIHISYSTASTNLCLKYRLDRDEEASLQV